MKDSYFYKNPAGLISGPLPIDSVRVAVKVGRLPAGTMVSETGGEPWLNLNLVDPEMAARESQIRAAQTRNLVSCSACGRPIANDAPACPHCGKRYATPVGLIFSVVIGLAIGLIFIIIPMCRAMGIW